MISYNIITLFPESFRSAFSSSILKRALEQKKIVIKYINPRDFAKDAHKTVDDKPYGGGKGMVAKVNIMVSALESIKENSHKILLSASGQKYNQSVAQKLSKKSSITLVCGHYEGVDARVEKFVDEVITIGDFILTGGEIAAMAIIDSVTRLLPGVIKKESSEIESFSPLTINPLRERSEASHIPFTLLEFPQYTRPENFQGQKVPQVLLSGNHAKIQKWRLQESLKRTKKFRPDLIKSKSE